MGEDKNVSSANGAASESLLPKYEEVVQSEKHRPTFESGNEKVHLSEQAASKFELDENAAQLKGWSVVGAVCLMMTGVAGFMGSFGNVTEFLQQDLNSSESVISAIGSLTFGLAMGLCPLSFVVMKKIGVRKTCLIGALLWLVGLLASSFVTNPYVLLLTYSVFLGVGANLCFNPSMILVGSHFTNKNQAIASCLATAGISIGNLSINPLMGHLLDTYGWRVTFRMMCAFVVTAMLISIAFYRKPDSQKTNDAESQTTELKAEEKRAKLSTPKMLLNPGVALWMVATLLWSVSFIFPLIHLVKYVKTTPFNDTTEPVTTNQANFVMLVFGIFELIGRFVGGISAERSKINLTYVYTIFTTVAGVVTIATVPVNSFKWMYFYAICCGITSGVANSMIYVTTHKLFGSFYGNRIWTYVNVMVALGAAGGPTLAGVLFDATHSYNLPFNIAGSVFIASGVVMVATKLAVDKHPLK